MMWILLLLIAAVQCANECCRSDCPGSSGDVCVDCQVFGPGGFCTCPSMTEICSQHTGCCELCTSTNVFKEDLEDIPIVFPVDLPNDIFMLCPTSNCTSGASQCPDTSPEMCCRTDCPVGIACEERPLDQDECTQVIQDIECPRSKVCCREDCVDGNVCKRILFDATCDPSSLDCETAPPTTAPTDAPTTEAPTEVPTDAPTPVPTTETPTEAPTTAPPTTAPPSEPGRPVGTNTPTTDAPATDRPTDGPQTGDTPAPPSPTNDGTTEDTPAPPSPTTSKSAIKSTTNWLFSLTIVLLFL